MGTCLSTGKNKGKISPSPAQSLRNLSKQGSKKPPRRSLSGKRIPGAEFPLPELEPPPQIFTLTAPRHLERPNAVTDDFVLDERHPLGLSSPFQACTCLATGDQHVYRKLYKDGQNLQQALSVQAELNVLQDVAPHPSLLAVHAIYDHEDVYCVVYNRWGSTMDLFDWVMSRQTGLPEAEAAHIMRQVLEVLVHLQSQGVLHRDVSLENLLVWPNPSIQHHMPTSLMNMSAGGGAAAQTLMAPRSPSSVPLLQSRPPPWDSDSHVPPASGAGTTPRVMVTGLASAVHFKEGQPLEGITGNSYYIAPEVIQGRHGKEAEVWACGVLLYIMLCGYPPFQGDDELEVFTSVLSLPPDFSEPPWPSISPAAQALVQSCLSHDVKARPTIRQLLDHPWVNNPPRALPGAVASKPSAAAAAG